jgi:hypothetical protein
MRSRSPAATQRLEGSSFAGKRASTQWASGGVIDWRDGGIGGSGASIGTTSLAS